MKSQKPPCQMRDLFATDWTEISRDKLAKLLRRYRKTDCVYWHRKGHATILGMFNKIIIQPKGD